MTEFDLGRIIPIDKGEWNDTYSTDAGPGYEKLDKVTSGSGSYLSLVANNTAPLTDRESWFPYVDGASIDALVVALNTAKQNAITAAGAANTQALFAEEKGNLAHTKAGEAEAAKVAANTAAGAANTQALFAEEKGNLAHTKAGEAEAAKVAANTAAAAANDAALAIAAEIAAKQNKVDQNLNTTDKTVVGAINEVLTIFSTEKPQGVAVRRWNTTLSTPIGEAYGDLDFLRELPRLLGLGCYLVQKDHTRRKLNPNNHYQFLDGTEAKLDGSMGDYMWGWNTKFYYAYWTEGDYYYEGVSLHPIPGKLNHVIPIGSTSALGVSVVDRTNTELVSVVSDLPRYRGGNNNSALDSAYNTMLGRAATNLSQDVFGSFARKKGLGWEAYWYAFPGIIHALTRIILGTRNLQTAFNPAKDANGLYQGGLGNGVTTVSSAEWSNLFSYYGFIPTSVGVELGDACGESSYDVPNAEGGTWATVKVPVFFGLKNMFGYLWRQERGKTFSCNADTSRDLYVIPKMHTEININTLDGFIRIGTTPTAQGYIKALMMQNLSHFCIETGGSSATYYADQYYQDSATSGLRLSLLGGSASNGGSAGPEYSFASNAVTSATASNGSPLCESSENWDTTPLWVD